VSPRTLTVSDPEPGLRIITLARPQVLNALSLTLVRELTAELGALLHDHAIRCVILTGDGRAFCSGADLSPEGFPDEPRGVSAERHWTGIQRWYSDLIVALRRIPQIVIAAVNGPAVGGGLSLSLASDIRLCDPGAYFQAAQINIGQSVSEMGASYLLPRVVGGRAAEILLTGRRVTSAEAERIGLVSTVSEPGEVLAAARSVAAELLAKAPLALRLSKEALNASLSASSLEAAITMEDRTQTLCVLSADLREAALAFREKRPPHFGG
jgi:enoyl-CoA hydratase